VSATIQPHTPRIAQNRQEPATPVGLKAPAAQAPAPSPADAQASQPKDGFEQASAKTAQQQEWATKFGANSQGVLKQTSDDNCGPAAALIAAGVKGGEGAAQRMAELEAKFTSGNGTSAQQLSQMLAHEGVAVKQGSYKYDQAAVDQSLTNGGKILALVDSNGINPGANKQEAGNAHWVVIDGKDSQGNYTVKDPGTGSAYNLDFSSLSNAIDRNWVQNNAGGMLLVENAAGSGAAAGAGSRGAVDQLARENLAMSQTVTPTPGIGSKGDQARAGRESSIF
jgi:hypothetical protein